MVNYKNSKLYLIRSRNSDKVYVGSTCNTLTKRLSQHKNNYKTYLAKDRPKQHYVSVYVVFDCNDVYIELLKNCPCEDKNELRKIEGETIRNTECVNLRIAGRTTNQYYEEHKEHLAKCKKQYRLVHKEHLAKCSKQYAKENKEHIKDYQKQYGIDNKEHLKERSRQYYLENKELIIQRSNARFKTLVLVRTDCACGGHYTTGGKKRHLRTRRCLDYHK